MMYLAPCSNNVVRFIYGQNIHSLIITVNVMKLNVHLYKKDPWNQQFSRQYVLKDISFSKNDYLSHLVQFSATRTIFQSPSLEASYYHMEKEIFDSSYCL